MRLSLKPWITFLLVGLLLLGGGACSVGELDLPVDGQMDGGGDFIDADHLDATPPDATDDGGGVVGDAVILDTQDPLPPDADSPDRDGHNPPGDINEPPAPDIDEPSPPDTTPPDPPDTAEPTDPDPPEPDPCPNVKVTASDGAKIRSSAQASASVVAELGKNSILVKEDEVQGESVGGSRVWYAVSSPKGNGYLPGAHVTCTTSAPHIVEPPEPEPPCPNVRVDSSTGVIIRAQPKTTGAGNYVGTLCNRSVVKRVKTVDGENIEGDTTWYQIESSNGNGYITGKYSVCTTAATVMTGC